MTNKIKIQKGDIAITDPLGEAAAAAECDKQVKKLKQLGMHKDRSLFVARLGDGWAVYLRSK